MQSPNTGASSSGEEAHHSIFEYRASVKGDLTQTLYSLPWQFALLRSVVRDWGSCSCSGEYCLVHLYIFDLRGEEALEYNCPAPSRVQETLMKIVLLSIVPQHLNSRRLALQHGDRVSGKRTHGNAVDTKKSRCSRNL